MNYMITYSVQYNSGSIGGSGRCVYEYNGLFTIKDIEPTEAKILQNIPSGKVVHLTGFFLLAEEPKIKNEPEQIVKVEL